MLVIKNLYTSYGGIEALKGISLHINQNELVTLIGANGSGKTSVLNCISSCVPVKYGEIFFENKIIIGMSPDTIVQLGIIQVPEGRQIFTPMTVDENLELGAYLRFKKKLSKKTIQADLDKVHELFPILKERRKQLAGTLSGGEQQMLALGRALMAKPKLLLLDEPSMGLAPIIVSTIMKVIKELNQSGMSILMVEQNAKAALNIVDRGYVLETGFITLQGSANQLARDGEVKRAYLGKDYKDFLG